MCARGNLLLREVDDQGGVGRFAIDFEFLQRVQRGETGGLQFQIRVELAAPGDFHRNLEFAGGCRFPNLRFPHFNRQRGRLAVADGEENFPGEPRPHRFGVVIAHAPSQRAALRLADHFGVADLGLADDSNWPGPALGIRGRGEKEERGIFARLDFRAAPGYSRRKSFDAELNVTVKVIATEGQDFEREGIAAAQQGGPGTQFAFVLVDQRRGLREGDELEIGRFGAQGEPIDMARIAMPGVEEVAKLDAIGGIFFHLEAPGRIAGGGFELHSANVGVGAVNLLHIRRLFFALGVFLDLLDHYKRTGRHAEALGKNLQPIDLPLGGREREPILIARGVKLPDDFARQRNRLGRVGLIIRLPLGHDGAGREAEENRIGNSLGSGQTVFNPVEDGVGRLTERDGARMGPFPRHSRHFDFHA